MERITNYSLMFCLLSMSMACRKNNHQPTVTDFDGNVYHTVKIGTQTWMVENLKTTHYNDGVAISNIQSTNLWTSTATGAYCWVDNALAKKEPYGALYNAHALNSGKLAPKGWHIPSKAEWQTLVNYVGGRFSAGSKLKASGDAHWGYADEEAKNTLGFSGVGTGIRSPYDGEFSGFHEKALFWSSTPIDGEKMYITGLLNGDEGIFEQEYLKNTGLSVRCIKD